MGGHPEKNKMGWLTCFGRHSGKGEGPCRRVASSKKGKEKKPYQPYPYQKKFAITSSAEKVGGCAQQFCKVGKKNKGNGLASAVYFGAFPFTAASTKTVLTGTGQEHSIPFLFWF